MKDFLDGDIYKFNLEKCGFPHDTLGNLTEETQYNGNAASIMQVSVPLTLGLVITYKTIVIYSWSQLSHFILSVFNFSWVLFENFCNNFVFLPWTVQLHMGARKYGPAGTYFTSVWG